MQRLEHSLSKAGLVLTLASLLALACGERQVSEEPATQTTGSEAKDTSSTGPVTSDTSDPTQDTEPETSSEESDESGTDEGPMGECGDGVLDPGEDCDEGPANAWEGACKPDCTQNVCGDGHVGPEERCDDGNTEGLDLCSADCRTPLFVCGNQIWACGDTIDNDGDGLVDLDDPECISACDDAEHVFEPGLPGQNCVCCDDCLFDDNSGVGDDWCDYEPGCDPLLPDPECGPRDPNWCAQLVLPPECLERCGPLTPNGCDCFGCCVLEGEARWIGIREGYSSCSMDNLQGCPPCTITPSCFDACEPESCELCFPDPPSALAPGCEEPSCSGGALPCTDPYACPEGEFCQAGCCRAIGIP